MRVRAGSAIAQILRAITDVLHRQDVDRQKFEVEMRALAESNNKMLRELLTYASQQDREIEHVRQDLKTHTRDDTRHAPHA